MNPDDTIFALSSGKGRAGVAVIRLSGIIIVLLLKILVIRNFLRHVLQKEQLLSIQKGMSWMMV